MQLQCFAQWQLQPVAAATDRVQIGCAMLGVTPRAHLLRWLAARPWQGRVLHSMHRHAAGLLRGRDGVSAALLTHPRSDLQRPSSLQLRRPQVGGASGEPEPSRS